MTVYSKKNKITYVGNPSQILYPIPFEFIKVEDIKVSIYTKDNVFVENWTLSSQYIIDNKNIKVLEGNEIDSSKKMLVKRVLESVQDNKYREGGDFPAKSTETSFDKNVMLIQQLNEEVSRCPKADSIYTVDLTLPAPEANKGIVWNETGDGFRNTVVDIDNVEAETKRFRDEAEQFSIDANNSAVASEASAVRSEASAQSASNTVAGFDQHVADATNAFDVNAANLTARYDNNALAKTKAFNENAQTMTDGYNTNAMLKIDDFDAHAMEKEIAFDDNASAKTSEFNTNAKAKQDLVDASASAAKNSENASGISEDNARESERKARIWAEGTKEEVISIGGEDSSRNWADISKYWAGQSASGSIQPDWNQTDTTAKDYIKNKPDVMTIDTDQEVSSSKTFMQDQAIKSPDLDIRTDRSKRGNGLIFTDKNGTQTAGIGVYVNNNQSPECRLVASNGTQSAFAGLGVTTDGQGFFEVPTPKDGSNNRDAVNSEWVHRELTTHYVDKKGDTMIGALNFGTSGYIEANKSNSTKGLALFGSIDGYGQGASIALRDNTADGSQAGVFKLETGNNVTGHTHTLQGNPDGTVTWDTKELANVDLDNISQTGKDSIDTSIKTFLETVYSVGSLYFSTAETCPLQAVGIGTWETVGTSLVLNVGTRPAVVGNGKALGLYTAETSGVANYVGVTTLSNSHTLSASGDAYGKTLPLGAGRANVPLNKALGVTLNSTNSGMVAQVVRTQITVNVFQRTA